MQKFGNVAHSLPPSDSIRTSFAHAYKRIDSNSPGKVVSLCQSDSRNNAQHVITWIEKIDKLENNKIFDVLKLI